MVYGNTMPKLIDLTGRVFGKLTVIKGQEIDQDTYIGHVNVLVENIRYYIQLFN